MKNSNKDRVIVSTRSFIIVYHFVNIELSFYGIESQHHQSLSVIERSDINYAKVN